MALSILKYCTKITGRYKPFQHYSILEKKLVPMPVPVQAASAGQWLIGRLILVEGTNWD